MVLWKFALRHIMGRPGRTTLTLLSVVIAVAAVTSVTIATSTTRVAYREMFASVSGRSELEVTAAGGGSFDESILEQVRQTPGVRVAVPVVQRPTIMYARDRRVKLVTLGIDPKRDREVRDYTVAEGRFVNGDDGILLETSFARDLGVKVGDEVKLLTPRRRIQRVDVIGLLASEGASAMRLGGLVFMPLSQAQSLFTGPGQIDSIEIVLDPSADADAVEKELADRLPTGTSVRPPATRTRLVEETLSSSEQGLQLASSFSLLLATFIILNTSMMNVGERRRQLAIMRAIGATRSQLGRLLYSESLGLGIIGTVLGSLAGWAGAYVLIHALDRILLAPLPPIQISPWPFVLATVCGLGVSLLGAAIPAHRAAQLTPLEGMTHITHEDIEGSSRKTLIVGALITMGSGGTLAACILGWLPIDVAVLTAVVLLVGVVLLTPAMLSGLSQAAVWVISPLLRVESRLAHRQILRHRGRSTLTVGVLFLAAATGIGMASAVLDNVRDVRQWYQQTIVGDFFIRAMMPDMATGLSADMPDELGPKLRGIPGITNIETARWMQARAEDMPVIVIVRDFISKDMNSLALEDGDPAQVREDLFGGDVVIGTVLSQRTGLKTGDTITLETRQGAKELRIAALTNEYLVGGLAVYMERGVAKRLLNVDGVDAYGITVDPQAVAGVERELKALTDEYGLMLYRFADVRSMIDGMIAGIQGCLWGILVLGFLVASFGVVNTLTMNVLEQTRELGLLRIVAMTRWQVRRTIFTQAVVLASIGVVPGVAAGVGIAYLINLATMSAIGHPIPFGFHPWLLVAILGGGLTLVLVAALIPAERAARLALAEALQYE
jgi:putative ABC transport system permease protein